MIKGSDKKLTDSLQPQCPGRILQRAVGFVVCCEGLYKALKMSVTCILYFSPDWALCLPLFYLFLPFSLKPVTLAFVTSA